MNIKRFSTDTRILIGALVALVLVAAIMVLLGPPPGDPPLSVRSTEAYGAMALELWLERSGYTVQQVLSNPIQPQGVDVLFILYPLLPYSEAEAEAIQEWVQAGNTLIVAGHPFVVNSLLEPYGVSLALLGDSSDKLVAGAPTLTAPALDTVKIDSYYPIHTDRSDLVIHLVKDTALVLGSINEGRGKVWIAGTLRPFTNRGLHDAGSGELILNLLAHVRSDAIIGFDEARHGYGESSQSLSGWLFGTSPGLGIVTALVFTMTYLILRGRRFGRALPIPHETLRREPVEYIQAMANLFRRSGQRTEILRHYRSQLRRRLSEYYGFDPHITDDTLVKTIIFHDPGVDESELRALLKSLAQTRVSEKDLIHIALEVDNWLRRIH